MFEMKDEHAFDPAVDSRVLYEAAKFVSDKDVAFELVLFSATLAEIENLTTI